MTVNTSEGLDAQKDNSLSSSRSVFIVLLGFHIIHRRQSVVVVLIGFSVLLSVLYLHAGLSPSLLVLLSALMFLKNSFFAFLLPYSVQCLESCLEQADFFITRQPNSVFFLFVFFPPTTWSIYLSQCTICHWFCLYHRRLSWIMSNVLHNQ